MTLREANSRLDGFNFVNCEKTIKNYAELRGKLKETLLGGDMIKRYVKISIPDFGEGGYTMPIDEVSHVIEAEFDGADIGSQIVLTLCEMEEEAYKKMSEFMGW